MDNLAPFLDEQLDRLARQSHCEFNDVGDYVWKSPKLIRHETDLELGKLKRFPSNKRYLASLRWRGEAKKLEVLFPSLISVGNLFNAASLFERYLLLLASLLQDRSGKRIEPAKGQGLTKLFNYFKECGLPGGSVPLYEQVQAAARFRNCLVHAGGILAWSRDAKEIKRIQSNCSYLSPSDRKRSKQHASTLDKVTIADSELGECLKISNDYSFVVVFYFRDYFLALCRATDDLLKHQFCKANSAAPTLRIET